MPVSCFHHIRLPSLAPVRQAAGLVLVPLGAPPLARASLGVPGSRPASQLAVTTMRRLFTACSQQCGQWPRTAARRAARRPRSP